MTTLDQVIESSITVEDSFPTALGFGTPLLLAMHTLWAPRLKTITAIKDLTDLAVPTTHPVHRMVTKAFSQTPRPPKVIVGKRTRLATQIVNLIPRDFRADTVYEFDFISSGGVIVEVSVANSAALLARVTTAVFGTDTLTAASAHGLAAGDEVMFTNVGGAIPAPLALLTTYYVIATGLTATEFQVSATLGGAAVNLTDNGTGVTTTRGAANALTLSAALTTALAAAAGVDVAATATHLSITSDTAGALFNLSKLPGPSTLAMLDVSTDPGIAADLTDCEAAEDENNSWYGVVRDTVAASETEAAAAWMEARNKIAVWNTCDWDTADADEEDDILTTLQTLGYHRSMTLVSFVEMLSYSAVAWMASKLPTLPGAATWNGAKLAATATDKISGDQDAAILGKFGNTYTNVAGLGWTSNSKAASGRFIDITHLTDWTNRRIQEAGIAALANRTAAGSKVPFTDEGIQILNQAVTGVLGQASSPTQPGYIPAGADGGWYTVVPRAKDVPLPQKAERRLYNVRWYAKLQGAIHSAQIIGGISL